MPTTRDATTALAELHTQRARAAGRVEELEREQRARARTVQDALAALAEHERRAGPAQSDPSLAAKLDGARARVRDVDGERRHFIAAHLRELLEPVEADGRAAVDAILPPLRYLTNIALAFDLPLDNLIEDEWREWFAVAAWAADPRSCAG